MHGHENARNGSHGIPRIHLSDGALAVTAAQQRYGKQRQGRSREECRWQHDGNGNGCRAQ